MSDKTATNPGSTTLAALVTDLIASRNLSLTYVSNALGYSPSWMKSIVDGRTKSITVENALKLAEIFSVDPHIFLFCYGYNHQKMAKWLETEGSMAETIRRLEDHPYFMVLELNGRITALERSVGELSSKIDVIAAQIGKLVPGPSGVHTKSASQ